jgi:hypothetical protein
LALQSAWHRPTFQSGGLVDETPSLLHPRFALADAGGWNWREVDMTYAPKIVLHCSNGYDSHIDGLIEAFIRDGVKCICVAGLDCDRIEDIIDEILIGDGSDPHFIVTTSHKTVEEAIEFARISTGNSEGKMQVVEV